MTARHVTRMFVTALSVASAMAIIADWAHMRFLGGSMKETAFKCVELAARQAQANEACTQSLLGCRSKFEDDAIRARLILATKIQTIDLIKRSYSGDQAAKSKLEEFGWTKDLDSIGRKIAENHKNLVEAAGIEAND